VDEFSPNIPPYHWRVNVYLSPSSEDFEILGFPGLAPLLSSDECLTKFGVRCDYGFGLLGKDTDRQLLEF
jgi:hypothetical protein